MRIGQKDHPQVGLRRTQPSKERKSSSSFEVAGQEGGGQHFPQKVWWTFLGERKEVALLIPARKWRGTPHLSSPPHISQPWPPKPTPHRATAAITLVTLQLNPPMVPLLLAKARKMPSATAKIRRRRRRCPSRSYMIWASLSKECVLLLPLWLNLICKFCMLSHTNWLFCFADRAPFQGCTRGSHRGHRRRDWGYQVHA